MSAADGDPAMPASPFDQLLGTRVVQVTGAETTAELPIGPHLHQPTGLVHGGVYASVIETVASVGASAWLEERARAGADDAEPGSRFSVGLSNHTDFLRSTRDGLLTFTAHPLQQGRRFQTWRVDVTDPDARLVATGTVKLANVERR